MIILFLLSCVNAHLFKQNTKVLQLNALELDSQIQSKQPFYLMLYASWCGHCKKLVPIIDSLADETNFTFVAIDCDENVDVKNRFQVKGYPTLYLIKDDQMYRYQQARTKEALMSFASSSDLQNALPIPALVVGSGQSFIGMIIEKWWITGAFIALTIGTLVVSWLFYADYKQRKKLKVMEEALNEEKKNQ